MYRWLHGNREFSGFLWTARSFFKFQIISNFVPDPSLIQGFFLNARPLDATGNRGLREKAIVDQSWIQSWDGRARTNACDYLSGTKLEIYKDTETFRQRSACNSTVAVLKVSK
jgi:hypothetical protein